jgi:hypothetical protein
MLHCEDIESEIASDNFPGKKRLTPLRSSLEETVEAMGHNNSPIVAGQSQAKERVRGSVLIGSSALIVRNDIVHRSNGCSWRHPEAHRRCTLPLL